MAKKAPIVHPPQAPATTAPANPYELLQKQVDDLQSRDVEILKRLRAVESHVVRAV